MWRKKRNETVFEDLDAVIKAVRERIIRDESMMGTEEYADLVRALAQLTSAKAFMTKRGEVEKLKDEVQKMKAKKRKFWIEVVASTLLSILTSLITVLVTTML